MAYVSSIERIAQKKGKLEGLREGELKGKREGMREGIREGILKTAKNMINKGIDIETIIEVTGFTREEIEELQQTTH